MQFLWIRFAVASTAINWLSIVLAIYLSVSGYSSKPEFTEVETAEESYRYTVSWYLSQMKKEGADKHQILEQLHYTNSEIWDNSEHTDSKLCGETCEPEPQTPACHWWQPLQWDDQCLGQTEGQPSVLANIVSVVFSFWYDELLHGIALMSIAFSVAFGFIYSWRLKKPVFELLTVLTRLSERWHVRPLVTPANTKASNLVTSLNNMVTQLKQAEQKRSDLLADVSHELRQPLTGLKCVLQAALDQKTPQAKANGFKPARKVAPIKEYSWRSHCNDLYQFPVAA